MNLAKRLCLTTLGVSLLASGVSASPGEAAGAADFQPSPASVIAPRADPPAVKYLYRASFTAEVTHHLVVDWGDQDNEKRDVSVSISGTIPSVTATVDSDRFTSWSSGGTPGRVRVTRAEATGSVRTNSGQFVKTCSGSSGTATGAPSISIRPDLEDWILPYALLTVPTSCTDGETGEKSEMSYQYGPLWHPFEDLDASAGARSASVRFSGYVSRDEQPQLCPGFIEGQTPTCNLRVDGTMRLDLVRKIEPPKNPPGAVVTPRATKAKAVVRCPKRCKITIELFPLKGGPRLTVPRTFRAKAGRTTSLSVPIPARKRALPACWRRHVLPDPNRTSVTGPSAASRCRTSARSR
jgi:hypothetical protein